MRIVLGCFISFLAFISSASEDPCDTNNYPIKNSRKLTHPPSYSLPAIYYRKDNSTVIVPVKDAIELTKENINNANSILKLVKTNILNSLNDIEIDELIDSESLWSWPDKIPQENYEVAIQTVIGYQAIFEKSLLRNLAVVKIDDSLVESSFFKYSHGTDSTATDKFNQVHKVVVLNKNKIIYERCWFDM
ncbi:hypothetical protein [Psychrobium sp. 1_MG-2023]|uniref:hypothetical protein n=1 Tax=Psychrobium sp. 1_MG-2023 TaxID=3062624 RepID=UPI000C31FF53|nr:hypothetical protein [Psychrobium sp. 1_MG-2023]MDP2560104.1 hypothetical protein [Psychrobium sp. 1_MG-2023]PKF56920.1 hypothetical protein CW748_07430 [Alteromonadales bacterium alter-6D02]